MRRVYFTYRTNISNQLMQRSLPLPDEFVDFSQIANYCEGEINKEKGGKCDYILITNIESDD